MLGRRRKETRSAGPLTETYIGKGTRIEGTLFVGGSLRIDGEVIGEIQSGGDVLIGESGDVQANVTAVNLVVGGRLTGTAAVQERLELLATGKVTGDATMQTLVVEQGGVLEGSSQMASGHKVDFDHVSSDSVSALDPVG